MNDLSQRLNTWLGQQGQTVAYLQQPAGIANAAKALGVDASAIEAARQTLLSTAHMQLDQAGSQTAGLRVESQGVASKLSGGLHPKGPLKSERVLLATIEGVMEQLGEPRNNESPGPFPSFASTTEVAAARLSDLTSVTQLLRTLDADFDGDTADLGGEPALLALGALSEFAELYDDEDSGVQQAVATLEGMVTAGTLSDVRLARFGYDNGDSVSQVYYLVARTPMGRAVALKAVLART